MRPYAFLAAALLLTPLVQGGTAGFVEDWESGSDGWINDGIGSVVCGPDGCHAKLIAGTDRVNHQYMTHDFAVAAPVGATWSFRFMGEDAFGLTDLTMELHYDSPGGSLQIELTRDASTGNNGIRFITTGLTDPAPIDLARDVLPPIVERRVPLPETPSVIEGPTISGWSSGEWLEFRVHLDFAADIAYAEIYDANGELWDILPPVPVADDATAFTRTRMAVGAWYGANVPSAFHVDDIRVTPIA